MKCQFMFMLMLVTFEHMMDIYELRVHYIAYSPQTHASILYQSTPLITKDNVRKFVCTVHLLIAYQQKSPRSRCTVLGVKLSTKMLGTKTVRSPTSE